MTNAMLAPNSSLNRPLGLRRRPDLEVRTQRYQGRVSWIVKDPLALRYFRFEEEEYAILSMLDEHGSLDGLRQEFERRFAPQTMESAEIQRLLAMLHRCALIVSDRPGQGRELHDRAAQRRRQERYASLLSILNMRFRGIDPDRWLTVLDQRIGWIFDGWALMLGLVYGLSALVLLFAQFDTFRARLPSLTDFFGPGSWLMLATVLAVTKIAHEFGHGIACKHYGGECHEMGVMLLVFTPCLYCNVTDSWMVSSKWRRAMVGAAGMYVELFIAATATWLWWFSHPGSFHLLCLRVMFVCSVSTLVFNANPLMRYDGYYILSDLVEIPNLRQKAGSLLHRWFIEWFLGMAMEPDPFLPQRRRLLFVAYALAAAVYRGVVTISILWFLMHVLAPAEMKVVGQTLAVLTMAGMIAMPMSRAVRFFWVPGRMQQMKWRRAGLRLGGALAALLGLVCLPWPYEVQCDCVVQHRDAAAVYVDAAGSLSELHVRPGDSVRQGDPLVTLVNLEMQTMLEKLQGEQRIRKTRLVSGQQRALAGDEAAARELESIRASIEILQQQIERTEEDLRRLQICAPKDGVVIPASYRDPKKSEAGKLGSWSGTPLDQKNRGAFLSSGITVCRVGEPARLKVVLAIDQTDLPFVQPGNDVRVLLKGAPDMVLKGRIDQLASDSMQILPRVLSSKVDGELATHTDTDGNERPVSATYQARVDLDEPHAAVLAGMTGRASIRAGSQSLAQRFWRFACHTFRVEM